MTRIDHLSDLHFGAEDQAVVNALIRAYGEQDTEARVQATSRATTWLESQLKELKVRVDQDQQRLAAFQREHGLLTTPETLEQAKARGGRGAAAPGPATPGPATPGAAPAGPVKVISAEYWPLPWYLRMRPETGYWSEPPADCDGALVFASADLAGTVRARLRGHYRESFLGLRPGYVLVVFTRQEP